MRPSVVARRAHWGAVGARDFGRRGVGYGRRGWPQWAGAAWRDVAGPGVGIAATRARWPGVGASPATRTRPAPASLLMKYGKS